MEGFDKHRQEGGNHLVVSDPQEEQQKQVGDYRVIQSLPSKGYPINFSTRFSTSTPDQRGTGA